MLAHSKALSLLVLSCHDGTPHSQPRLAGGGLATRRVRNTTKINTPNIIYIFSFIRIYILFMAI